MTDAAVLGSVTIPGRGEQVRTARAFVAGVLTDLGAGPEGVLDDAMLLTSELVTNAIRHSRSGETGGSVMLAVLAAGDSILVEVTDSGSATGAPVVRDDVYTCDGHGLFLVAAVADQWGYRPAAGAGTTVWFRLGLGTTSGIPPATADPAEPVPAAPDPPTPGSSPAGPLRRDGRPGQSASRASAS